MIDPVAVWAAQGHTRMITPSLPDSLSPAPASAQSGWFGHPRPLARLFTTEMWERMGFYGVRALLTLYLTKHFVLGDRAATGLYGGFTALVYLTPLVGGLIADQYLGSKRSVRFGAALMALGYFALAVGGSPARSYVSYDGASHEVVSAHFHDGPTSARDDARQVIDHGQHLTLRSGADGSLGLQNAAGHEVRHLGRGQFSEATRQSPILIAILLTALATIGVGNGFFKPNIATYVTAGGEVCVTDFMPPRGKHSDVVRVIRGVRGKVPMRMVLVLRFDYGLTVPWVTRANDELRAVAGPNLTVLRTGSNHRPAVEVHGEDCTSAAEFTVRTGNETWFTLTYASSIEDVPPRIDIPEAMKQTEALWDGVDWAIALPGRAPGGGGTQPVDAEGSDVCANGRDRGGGDDQPARVDRGCAQLGLSLLLAAGYRVHAAGADQPGVHGRGGALARMAVARGGGLSRPGAKRVRHWGRAAAG